MGEAFVGRSGKLLDTAIRNAGGNPIKYFFTNTLACRPCDTKDGPNRAPYDRETLNCAPRLHSILEAMHPGRIIFVGKIAQDWCIRYSPRVGKHFFIQHPAYILRQGGYHSGLFYSYVKKLRAIFKK